MRLVPRLPRFDWIVLAVLVASRLALIAADAPHRAQVARGEMLPYEEIYQGLAEHFVATGVYAWPPQDPASDVRRPPAYPLLVAATMVVAGRVWPVAVLLWNVVGVVVLYLGLLRLLALLGLGRRVAAAAFALDLAWLLYTKEVATEPIYTPMLVWALVALVEASQAPEARAALLAAARAGALLGMSALMKPISLYLPVVVVPWLLLVWSRMPRPDADAPPARLYETPRPGPVAAPRPGAIASRARCLGPALAFGVVFLACVAPWAVRNAVVHGTLSFTSIQNDNLLFAHGGFVRAEVEGETLLEAQEELDTMLTARLAGAPRTFAAENAEKARLARAVLSAHPLVYAGAILRGVAVTLFDPGRLVFNRTVTTEDTRAIGLTNTVARDGILGTAQALATRSPLTVGVLGTYLVFLVAVFAVAACGILPLARAQPAAFWLLLLVAGYLLALGGPNGYARFRLYVFPVELVFLQAGAEAIARRLARPTIESESLKFEV